MNAAPLVSIVITTFNHGEYISDAINSVLNQSYTAIELIVVDDGSTDKTKEIVSEYKNIRYFYQDNQGLSAARNVGIELSNGDFILFLDADDWLYRDAIQENITEIVNEPDIAFVSGTFDMVNNDDNVFYSSKADIRNDYYIQLLKHNFIAMHATVLYRRSVFKDLRFDTSLKACEDYDIYLRITRKNSIKIHSKRIAAYRQHENNMSSYAPLMLKSILEVLDRQKSFLQNVDEKLAWKQGRVHYINYYIEQLVNQKLRGEHLKCPNFEEIWMMIKYLKPTLSQLRQ